MYCWTCHDTSDVLGVFLWKDLKKTLLMHDQSDHDASKESTQDCESLLGLMEHDLSKTLTWQKFRENVFSFFLTKDQVESVCCDSWSVIIVSGCTNFVFN